MLTTKAPQNIHYQCNEKEFMDFSTGAKNFHVQDATGSVRLREGDWLTVEELNKEGETTGNRLMLQVGSVAAVGEEGKYEVLGFVPPEYKNLSAIYDDHVTVSLVIDRYKDPESGENKKEVAEHPAYTPQLVCPDMVSLGLLNSLNADVWPPGRYSVTLLLSLSIDEEHPTKVSAQIEDAMVLTYVQRADDERSIVFVDLDWTALMGGHAINMITNSKVTPCELDVLGEILSEAASKENLAGHDELISDEELRGLIAKAKAEGQDVSAFEAALRMTPEDIEAEENRLDPVAARLMDVRKEEM